ncbi:TRAP transporter substrate-binding protein DctP [Desulforhopalus singaporensis]|uniref:TRAP-type C4-dicarboxylate transport system, substrate-binding protein n=1 Tax=Desulforhopalus singaporensis TaxID=91360 RepID=A0A1H0W005_9BACT|nr:TRAP transporter substrate-binding protein DctP [Desulforhopalus singaporensis]SDP84002.1 TRAP-type C4-dicarboxylate transport system, substrate-binding protein [Desulforhopalus singaporensis]
MLRITTALIAFFVLLASFSVGMCSGNDKVYQLKMQSFYPQSMAGAQKGFAETVEKMSGGRIKITFFTSGELISSPEILKATKTGMIDIGMGSGSYFSELTIGNIETGLPMAWQNAYEARVLWEELGFKELLAKEYEKHGVHYLAPNYATPYKILTKTPVNSLEELKKLKIRAIGGSAKMLSNLGVATVSLPLEDIYLALTTGQIDGVLFGGANEYKMMKFYEAAKFYIANPILDPIVDSYFMNKKVWDSLPEDLQAIITVAATEAGLKHYDPVWKAEYTLPDTLFEDVTKFSEADASKLTDGAISVWEEEANRSLENAEAVEMIKELNRMVGRLN